MDAGFLTAAQCNPTFLRPILSIVFTAFYMVFAETAENKVIVAPSISYNIPSVSSFFEIAR